MQFPHSRVQLNEKEVYVRGLVVSSKADTPHSCAIVIKYADGDCRACMSVTGEVIAVLPKSFACLHVLSFSAFSNQQAHGSSIYNPLSSSAMTDITAKPIVLGLATV